MSKTRIGYARCSTDKQDLAVQRVALLDLDVAEDRIYTDHGLTGTNRERPGLAQALAAVREGDTLVVPKLDRLARSLKDLVEIVQDLNDREVGFKSLTEAIDTTNSGGRLVFHIFGALAEFEHDLIRERTKAGLQAARARGRKGGRKPSMSDSDIRKAAAMLSDPQITKTEVAAHFGVTRTTLNASLKRIGLAA